ncbi:MAG: hypothetical protein GTO41_05470, partial [Burkholderiales bacterium]|nr:hypothetical protein [Burkholderiales bacterium]
EGRLTFEMRKRLVACDYDELMIVTVHDVDEVDEVWRRAEEKGYPVTQVLYDIFP